MFLWFWNVLFHNVCMYGKNHGSSGWHSHHLVHNEWQQFTPVHVNKCRLLPVQFIFLTVLKLAYTSNHISIKLCKHAPDAKNHNKQIHKFKHKSGTKNFVHIHSIKMLLINDFHSSTNKRLWIWMKKKLTEIIEIQFAWVRKDRCHTRLDILVLLWERLRFIFEFQSISHAIWANEEIL